VPIRTTADQPIPARSVEGSVEGRWPWLSGFRHGERHPPRAPEWWVRRPRHR
jgi:hypothetical protein